MVNRRSFLLYPFSFVYGLATSFRNFLYDAGLISSEKFSVPVICVGNITVGGTGKTPHTEYLVDLLRKEFRVAVLSRGYKRKSKGFRSASSLSTVKEIGDEPFQLFRKFPDIIVAVDRDRLNGVKSILKDRPDINLIILDDGFQHRKIKPGLSILLSDFNNPMSADYMLPYGNLRESIKNIRRADVIVIAKSPENISEATREEITRNIHRISERRIFFTSISYKDPVPLFKEYVSNKLRFADISSENNGVVLLTGIASPTPLKQYIEKYFGEIIHLKLPDHHYFNENDIKKIIVAWNSLKSKVKYVITTEKDGVRLMEFTNIADFIKESIYYVPVGISFLNNGKQEFDNLIFDYVRKNKRDN